MQRSDFSKADFDMAIGWIPMPHLHSNPKNFDLTSEIHSALELHRVSSALQHPQVARSYRNSGALGATVPMYLVVYAVVGLIVPLGLELVAKSGHRLEK